MHVDGYTREKSLDLAACSFCLDTVVARVTSSKHLYTVACDLAPTLDHFLLVVNRIWSRCLPRLSLLPVSLFILFAFIILVCSSMVFSLVCLFGGSSLITLPVDEVVDRLVLSDGHFSFTRLALLEPLGESSLCIGCKDAADTQC